MSKVTAKIIYKTGDDSEAATAETRVRFRGGTEPERRAAMQTLALDLIHGSVQDLSTEGRVEILKWIISEIPTIVYPNIEVIQMNLDDFDRIQNVFDEDELGTNEGGGFL
ncbi:hypothetical protein ACEE90_03575 [Corynebacterium phoceense]